MSKKKKEIKERKKEKKRGQKRKKKLLIGTKERTTTRGIKVKRKQISNSAKKSIRNCSSGSSRFLFSDTIKV